jgi:hypothetical protein
MPVLHNKPPFSSLYHTHLFIGHAKASVQTWLLESLEYGAY